MISILPVVLILTLIFQTSITLDTTDEIEKDVSLSADTQTKLDAMNDVQELRKFAINMTKEKKKMENKLKTKLNYAMFDCALSIMKIDLEDAYVGQGIQKSSLKADEKNLQISKDIWTSLETQLGKKMANDTKTCFLKWNAFISRQKSYTFVQIILKKLAEYHKREVTNEDITDFTFSVARNSVFLRQESRELLEIVKRTHVDCLKKNERKTLVDLLNDEMLTRWHIREDDIVYHNIVRDSLLRKGHILMWSVKKNHGNVVVVLPYAPIEWCPIIES